MPRCAKTAGRNGAALLCYAPHCALSANCRALLCPAPLRSAACRRCRRVDASKTPSLARSAAL
eukprot:5621083-Lingulodinium_polyedra.AAC.1